jgi:hypothetical protein
MTDMTFPPPPEQPQYGQPQYGQPQGEPLYQPSAPPHYPPGQYAQPQYGQPMTGYVTRQRRVSEPVVGWLLLGVATLMIISATMPWATVLTFSVAGTVGGGKATLFFGLVFAAFGVLIGMRQGLVWVSITGCVLAVLVILIALGNMGDIANVARNQSVAVLGDSVSIGAGLWLTLVAGIAALTLSIIGIARRPVQNS